MVSCRHYIFVFVRPRILVGMQAALDLGSGIICLVIVCSASLKPCLQLTVWPYTYPCILRTHPTHHFHPQNTPLVHFRALEKKISTDKKSTYWVFIVCKINPTEVLFLNLSLIINSRNCFWLLLLCFLVGSFLFLRKFCELKEVLLISWFSWWRYTLEYRIIYPILLL